MSCFLTVESPEESLPRVHHPSCYLLEPEPGNLTEASAMLLEFSTPNTVNETNPHSLQLLSLRHFGISTEN